MKKVTRSHQGTLNELNITPLLDLVFVLLVIFIITTPQMMNNLEMMLPSGKPPAPKPDEPKPKINKIALNASGQIFLNEERIEPAGFKQKLEQMKKEDS